MPKGKRGGGEGFRRGRAARAAGDQADGQVKRRAADSADGGGQGSDRCEQGRTAGEADGQRAAESRAAGDDEAGKAAAGWQADGGDAGGSTGGFEEQTDGQAAAGRGTQAGGQAEGSGTGSGAESREQAGGGKAKGSKKAGKAPPTGERKYKDAAALHRKLMDYFEDCDECGKLYSEQGMAIYLGVTLRALDSWWRGERCQDLQEEVQLAYLRIAEQIMSDERYNEKGMISLKIFLLKQPKFGGYQDRIEARQDISVNVRMGAGMEESDFA